MKTKLTPLVATTALACVIGLTGCAGSPTVSSGSATVKEAPAVTQTTKATPQSAAKTTQNATTTTTTDQATTQQTAVTPSDPDNPDDLQVTDSGWFETDTGMIDMAVAIDNPNTTLQATDTLITVVGKDADGAQLFTGEFEVPVIPANTTNYYTYATGLAGGSFTTGSDQGSMPVVSAVEVSVSTPSWIEADSDTSDAYTLTDNGTTTEQLGTVFSGTVTANKSFPDADQTCVEVILLDGDGNIEGGYMKMVDATVDQSQDFEIYAVAAPSYASYKLVAVPWNDTSNDDSAEKTA